MRLLVLTILVGGVLTAGALAAGDYDRQVSSYTLTETRTSSPTSEDFTFDYVTPGDPDAKPPAVRRVVTQLPRGARYDTTAPEHCTATDAELIAQGGAACPPGSAIGMAAYIRRFWIVALNRVDDCALPASAAATSGRSRWFST